MPLLHNLRHKNGIFLFRRKVPAALQPLLKKREIVRSLGRCDPRTARFRAGQLWIVTERMFEMLKKFIYQEEHEHDLITPDELKRFVDGMLLLERHHAEWYASNYPNSEKANPIDRVLLELEVSAKRARADRLRHDITRVQNDIEDLTRMLEIPIREGSVSEQMVGRELLRAKADYYEQRADEKRKEHSLPDNRNLRSRGLDELEELLSDAWKRETSSKQGQGSGLQDGRHGLDGKVILPINTPASEVWDAFIEFRTAANFKEKPRKLRSSLNFWIAEYGDRPLTEWTHRMAENLRTIFTKLPHDYSQNKKKWKNFVKPSEIARAFQQEIEQASSEVEKAALREMGTARKTWNRHRSALSEFWKWGKLNDLVYPSARNPFDELFLFVDEDDPVAEGGSETRTPWEKEQIRALFASPLFAGCRSPHRRHVPGNLVIRDALYWVVLIVAYTGMRREEICQLRVEHLCCHDENIWYFDLKAPGLRLKVMKQRGKKKGRKDAGSKRWVTLPDALIQLGIVEALHRGREPNEHLFPDLYRSKSNDTFGDKLGQKFGTYRKNYDAARRKNGDAGHAIVPLYAHLRDLHSFRHSFCTEMMNAGVPQAYAEALTGHTSEARSSEFANYDHGRTLEVLKVASDKRVLPIDIPRLVEAAANSPDVNAALRGVD